MLSDKQLQITAVFQILEGLVNLLEFEAVIREPAAPFPAGVDGPFGHDGA